MLFSPLLKLLEPLRAKLVETGFLLIREDHEHLVHHLSPRDHQLRLDIGCLSSLRAHHSFVKRLIARGLS